MEGVRIDAKGYPIRLGAPHYFGGPQLLEIGRPESLKDDILPTKVFQWSNT